MKNIIIIQDWAGNVLFQGNYTDKQVDQVLNANRCNCDHGCKKCDETGYAGDFEIYWQNKNDKRNVYEYVNY